jgi:hypothetical protein
VIRVSSCDSKSNSQSFTGFCIPVEHLLKLCCLSICMKQFENCGNELHKIWCWAVYYSLLAHYSSVQNQIKIMDILHENLMCFCTYLEHNYLNIYRSLTFFKQMLYRTMKQTLLYCAHISNLVYSTVVFQTHVKIVKQSAVLFQTQAKITKVYYSQ